MEVWERYILYEASTVLGSCSDDGSFTTGERIEGTYPLKERVRERYDGVWWAVLSHLPDISEKKKWCACVLDT